MHHSQIGQLDRFLAWVRIRILKGIEMLHQSDDSVTSLREGVLLLNTKH